MCVCVVQESNQGKIEFELLNRIRVVSGHSFCFPIWIDIDIIPVRVGTCCVCVCVCVCVCSWCK